MSKEDILINIIKPFDKLMKRDRKEKVKKEHNREQTFSPQLLHKSKQMAENRYKADYGKS